MFYNNCKSIAYCVLFSILFPLIIFPSQIVAFPKELQTNSNANIETANGLHTVTLETPSGKVIVRLPDDMAAGDTISGTVYTVPNGNNEAEQKQNAVDLSSLLIKVDDWETPASNRQMKFEVPDSLKNEVINLTLRDAKRKTISALKIPTSSPVVQPSDYQLPSIGQTGHNINISGAFDGDISNTSCRIGDKQAIPLAESPRKTVFQSPDNFAGPTQIIVKEGNTTITQDFRNVGVNLSAPKLNLLKGESTTLTTLVAGLQGIQEPVSLQLNCTGSVNMQGGNVQNIQISPNNVQSDGTYTQTNTLTGIQAGGFDVTATVQTNQQPCNLAGKIVHIEGTPYGGADNLWFVEIKLQNGQKMTLKIRALQKPDLKFCNWILINSCKDGIVPGEDLHGYEKVPDPTKPAPTPTPKATPTSTPPPNTSVTPTPTPTPCKEGEKRNIRTLTKVFEYADEDSAVEFSSSSTSESGISIALTTAKLWRAGALVGKVITADVDAKKGSVHSIGFVFQYLEKGADILERLANSPIAGLNAGISANLAVTTKKITVSCITYEVCEKGKWVKKTVLEQVGPTDSIYKASKRAHLGDKEREKIEDKSRPQFLDPDKVDKWLKDFLEGELNKLKKAKQGYEDFVKNCK